MKPDIVAKKRTMKAFRATSITLAVLLIMFEAGSVLAGQARLDDSPVAFEEDSGYSISDRGQSFYGPSFCGSGY